jgi:glycosyltransferase involved in cell wall biosynthesis
VNNTLVSVIIPTKNRVQSTIRAIESCAKQTISNIEIIVVDDGSDDINRLHNWISKFDKCKFHLVPIQLDNCKGGSVARNIGARAAKGKFITFLDSDDVYLESTLEDQLKVHFQHSHDFISYGKAIRTVYVDNKAVNEIESVPDKGKSDSESVGEYLFLKNGKMFTPTLFMKKEVFDKVLFDENLLRHQDYGFVLRAESKGIKFIFIDKTLFRWISEDNGESSKTKLITISISYTFLELYSNSLDQYAINAYLDRVAASIAIRSREYRKFYKLIKKYKGRDSHTFPIFVNSVVKQLTFLIAMKLRIIFNAKL